MVVAPLLGTYCLIFGTTWRFYRFHRSASYDTPLPGTFDTSSATWGDILSIPSLVFQKRSKVFRYIALDFLHYLVTRVLGEFNQRVSKWI